jgi:hypothetical protein
MKAIADDDFNTGPVVDNRPAQSGQCEVVADVATASLNDPDGNEIEL